MATHKFVTSFEKPTEEIEQTTSLYQIATFMNPNTGFHHVRKFKINQKNEFVDITNHFISENRYKKLVSKIGPNKCKYYSVYDLNNVAYPNFAEVMTAKSDIIAVGNSMSVDYGVGASDNYFSSF